MNIKFGRFLRYAASEWIKPLLEEWKKYSLWTVIQSIPTYIFMYFLIGGDAMGTEARILLSVLLGWIITQVVRYLWLALNAPFRIIKEQDSIISSFEKVTDREVVIARLTDLWTEGTALRNKGEGLMHESRVEPWWNEHLEWRNKTKTTMALLDKNMARQWWTLGTYIAKRAFPHALSPIHAKRLQMFDAWLERLNEKIQELQGRTV